MGFNLYNAFPSDQRTLESALFWLSGGNQTLPNYNCQGQRKSVAIVTGTALAFSAEIGTVLELYRSPQVSGFLILRRKVWIFISAIFPHLIKRKCRTYVYVSHESLKYSPGKSSGCEMMNCDRRRKRDRGSAGDAVNLNPDSCLGPLFPFPSCWEY